MNKKIIIAICTIFGLLLSFACKPVFKVQSETISELGTLKNRTFKFFNPNDLPASNFAFSDNNKKLIYESVARELKSRGFNSVKDASLIVKIQGGTSREASKSSSNYNDRYNPYGYSGFNSPYYWQNDPWMDDDISKKTTTIIIDVLDSGTKKLLWQGVGTGTIGEKQDEVKRGLESAIMQIFEEFPIELNQK